MARRKKIDTTELTFLLADIYSPYMELAMNSINYVITEDTKELEVNPFYRFESIFNKLFEPEADNMELRKELLNCMLHYLNNIDIYAGMNRHEFMRLFIRRDIENGYFGETMKKRWKLFHQEEQETITTQMIDMYQTGSSVEIARKAILGVFHNGYLYFNKVQTDEIIIFVGVKEKEIYREKLQFLLELFMPVDFNYRVFWSKHFGIIGCDELMRGDSIALY